jgi:uncharacterized protein (DUF4415 family)
MYLFVSTKRLLQNDTISDPPAIFGIHVRTKIFFDDGKAPSVSYYQQYVPEDHMNKEFAQEWDATANGTSAASPAGSSAPRHNVVAMKQIVTIRLDTDMLEWFKGAGPGYQTRINQILRQHMADQQAAQQA